MTFKKPSQNGVAGVLERSVLSTERRERGQSVMEGVRIAGDRNTAGGREGGKQRWPCVTALLWQENKAVI